MTSDSEDRPVDKVCTNRDCEAYGLTDYTKSSSYALCKKKLKIRNGIDEPTNFVDGEIRSYGYKKGG